MPKSHSHTHVCAHTPWHHPFHQEKLGASFWLLFNLTDDYFPFNGITVGLNVLLGSLGCWFTPILTFFSWLIPYSDCVSKGDLCEQLLITAYFCLLETFSEPPCTSSQFCNMPCNRSDSHHCHIFPDHAFLPYPGRPSAESYDESCLWKWGNNLIWWEKSLLYIRQWMSFHPCDSREAEQR